MTVLEAIQSNPVFVNVPVNHIETLMVGRSVDGSAEYGVSSLKDVELVTADLYVAIATQPEFSEGNLSIKYDTAILQKRALNLYLKHDDDKASELGPTPINVSVHSVDD